MPEIQNPNPQGGTGGGGGQDMRTMLTIAALFALVFFGLQYFKQKKAPSPPAETMTQNQNPGQGSSQSTSPGTAEDSAVRVGASSAVDTLVENKLYTLRFSNVGGEARAWVLKNYKKSDGTPLDMVNQAGAAKFGFPLSIYTYDADLNQKLAKALFVPSATGTLTAPGKLEYRYSDGGVEATKTFTFDETYVVQAEVSVRKNGQPVRALVSWPAGLGDQEVASHYTGSSVDWSTAGKHDSLEPKKVSGGSSTQHPYEWAGISDLYFAAVFLPVNSQADSSLVSFHNEIQAPVELNNPKSAKSNVPLLGSAVGATNGTTAVRIYAGPKDMDTLAQIHATGADGKPGVNLEPLIQFGWLGIIAKPLFMGVRWMHDHIVPNWGWAIVFVTVIINLAMLPTRIQMMKSSLKMQRLQPKIDAIKNKYKHLKMNDPKRQPMNQEIFALQREEGVNMFGGCLPLLIQLPLLWAFYRMLSNMIELRQAHWLWLPDLTAPDPLHLLAIIVIVSMFVLQFMTPSPGMDPAQQRMMAFMMPAIFGFSMWHVAAGVALYWACGNIINFCIQMVMNQTSMGKEMKEIAARRAAKKLGKPTIAARR